MAAATAVTGVQRLVVVGPPTPGQRHVGAATGERFAPAWKASSDASLGTIVDRDGTTVDHGARATTVDHGARVTAIYHDTSAGTAVDLDIRAGISADLGARANLAVNRHAYRISTTTDSSIQAVFTNNLVPSAFAPASPAARTAEDALAVTLGVLKHELADLRSAMQEMQKARS